MGKILRIAVGDTIKNNRIEHVEIDWPELVRRLSRFKRTKETFEQFSNAPAAERTRIKDHGYFIGGDFKGRERRSVDMKARCLLTFDLDFMPGQDDPWDVDLAFSDYEYLLHSTHSHSPETPRYRLVMPLSRTVWPREYQAVARRMASLLDMEYFDETGFRQAQLMWWPSRSRDGEKVLVRNEGRWIDPDEVLASYTDWTDPEEWPSNSREGVPRSPAELAKDPADKVGVIGKFNRENDVHRVIRKYDLPYAQVADNRYRHMASEGGPGAVVYPSDKMEGAWLYSHHGNDPACGILADSWTLLRLHRYGHIDDKRRNLPPHKTASHQAMLEEFGEQIDPETEFSEVDVPVGKPDKPQPSSKKHLSGKTFDELSEDAVNLSKSKHEDFKKVLTQLAISRLSPIKEDLVLKEAAERTKFSLKLVKDEYRAIRGAMRARLGESKKDAESRIVDMAIEECFGGSKSVKRIGQQFWGYNKGLWSARSEEYVQGRIQKYIAGLYEKGLLNLKDRIVADHLEASKVSTISGTISKMTIMELARISETNADPLGLCRSYEEPVINCLNGEIYFRRDGTVTLQDHDPANFYTSQVACKYDEGSICPLWDEFLNAVFPVDGETIDPERSKEHLEEICGYILQMSRSLKTWCLFKGPKDTGKSTIASLLASMLGDSVISQEMSNFNSGRQFADHQLLGKLLLIDDDYRKGARLPDGFMKKVSEEKMLTADVKFAKPVSFKSRVVPLILSNYWPSTVDLTDAFRRRAVVFEFRNTFKNDMDGDFRRHRMIEEKDAIFTRFVHAFARLHKRGHYNPSVDCENARMEWLKNSNPLAAFVDDMLKVTNPETSKREKRSIFWEAYLIWIKRAAPSGKPLNRNEFYERLVGYTGATMERNNNRVSYFRGIRLKETDAPEMMSDDLDGLSDVEDGAYH